MESLSAINTIRHFPPKPISSLSFISLKPFSIPTKLPKFKIRSIKASHSSNSPNPIPNPKPISAQPLYNPSSLLKTTYVAAVTLSALLFVRFINKPLPVFAATIVESTVGKDEEELAANAVSEEDERKLEEDYNANPGNVQAIKLLMECKVKNRKFDEAIELLNKLIEIQPDELEWLLLKSHIYSNIGDAKSAKLGFEEVLAKDPLCVEAYHGVVMAVSENEFESMEKELTEVMKRIESAMEKCNGEEKKEDLRDFKLLVSQIKVMEGNYTEALEVYEELVTEDPKDFRPYLCQAIVYTILKQKDKAEEQFQKYSFLVPKDHPYAQYVYVTDDMVPSNMLSQKGVN